MALFRNDEFAKQLPICWRRDVVFAGERYDRPRDGHTGVTRSSSMGRFAVCLACHEFLSSSPGQPQWLAQYIDPAGSCHTGLQSFPDRLQTCSIRQTQCDKVLGSVSKLLFHGLGEGARIREITQRHGGRNNGSFVIDG